MSAEELHDPDFNGELPADFAELGAQLQADAQRLSGVYPACKPPPALIDALAVSKRQWWLRREVSLLAAGAATVLLVAGVLALVYAPQTSWTTQRGADPATAAEPPLVKNPLAAGEVDVVAGVGQQAAAVDVQSGDAIKVSAAALAAVLCIGGGHHVDVVAGLKMQVVLRTDVTAVVVDVVARIQLNILALQRAAQIGDVVGGDVRRDQAEVVAGQNVRVATAGQAGVLQAG